MDADVAILEKYKQENGVFSPTEQEKILLERTSGYEKAKAEETVKINTNNAVLGSIESQIDSQNQKLVDSQMADNAEIQSIRKELFSENEKISEITIQIY